MPRKVMEENNVVLNEKKPNKKKKSKLFPVIFWLGFTIVAIILTYPNIRDSFLRITNTTTIGGYEAEISGMSGSALKEIRDAAVAYNEKIAASQAVSPFYYQGSIYDDPEYENILKTSKNSKIMCTLEIPGINVYIPVVHGTRDEDLTTQLGHMHGTSVPIGGTSTHSVIAGHTGLQNADILTDLVKIKKDDEFYVHVLNEIHAYKVVDIKVVLPDETNRYLQVRTGKDLVTLFTCTPYGVNDHRLLVTGERQYPDIEVTKGSEGSSSTTTKKNREYIIRTILFSLIPLIVFIIGAYLVFRKKPDKKKRAKKSRSEEVKP